MVAAHGIPVQVLGAFGIAVYGGSAREMWNLCGGRRHLGLFAKKLHSCFCRRGNWQQPAIWLLVSHLFPSKMPRLKPGVRLAPNGAAELSLRREIENASDYIRGENKCSPQKS